MSYLMLKHTIESRLREPLFFDLHNDWIAELDRKKRKYIKKNGRLAAAGRISVRILEGKFDLCLINLIFKK